MPISRRSPASSGSGVTCDFAVSPLTNSYTPKVLANDPRMLLNQSHDWSTTGRSYVVHKRRHQRPKISSMGQKWRITYWDYTSGEARRRTKVWNKRKGLSRAPRRAFFSTLDRTFRANTLSVAPATERPCLVSTTRHSARVSALSDVPPPIPKLG
jgi:hypothetical protein